MVILALDDEPKELEKLVHHLKAVSPGAQIHDFTEVKPAVLFARKHEIDAAFLDIKMPEVSGVALAKKLLEIKPRVNVVFTTGHKEFALEALQMHVSGYLVKPLTEKAVKAEFEHFRYPVQEEKKLKVRAKTFGSFDLFLDNKPIVFHKERAKEIMAFLVDKRGSTATRKEIAATIFEDQEYTRSSQAYITNLFSYLRKCLKEYGVPELLLEGYNSYSVNTEMLDCDLYGYLDGDEKAMDAFYGEYMSQYSWAEDRVYQFYL